MAVVVGIVRVAKRWSAHIGQNRWPVRTNPIEQAAPSSRQHTANGVSVRVSEVHPDGLFQQQERRVEIAGFERGLSLLEGRDVDAVLVPRFEGIADLLIDRVHLLRLGRDDRDPLFDQLAAGSSSPA